MSEGPLRYWFQPGAGLDRGVISSGIQRFLGNNATVRPGIGDQESGYKGVEGYWIKAYRNLTDEMVYDLQRETQTWRKEQAKTGTKGSHSPMSYSGARSSAPDVSTDGYANSETRARSVADGYRSQRPSGDSPMREPTFSSHSQPSRDPRQPHQGQMALGQMPMDHNPGSRMPHKDQMPPPPDMRYPDGQFYPQDGRPYPPDGRPYQQDGRPYSQDHPMQDAQYGWPHEPVPFGQEPRYPPNYPPGHMDTPGPGYVRLGNGYVPVTSGFEPSSGMASTSRSSESAPFGSSPYGVSSPGPQGRETPRFGQIDYPQPPPPDQRYPYPSPATSSASMTGPSREPVTSPAQPRFAKCCVNPILPRASANPISFPPSQGQHNDHFGGRPAPSGFGNPGKDPGYHPAPPSRDHGFGNASRERLPTVGGSTPHPPPPSEYNNGGSGSSRDRPPPSTSDNRDARRRKMK